MDNQWEPIETCPVYKFDADSWYMDGPRYLLWNGYFCTIGRYGYTKTGKGRWRDHRGIVCPTHWMPLPEPPK